MTNTSDNAVLDLVARIGAADYLAIKQKLSAMFSTIEIANSIQDLVRHGKLLDVDGEFQVAA